MSVEVITNLHDPRVEPYRGLKDRELARQGERFIAEGELVVRRLLESGLTVESVLLAQRRVAEIAPLVPAGVPIYAVPDPMVKEILGFKFHSGVIAVGRRPHSASVEELMGRLTQNERSCGCTSAVSGERRHGGLTLLICPQVLNHDNLGSLLRIAAAFGVDAVLLGERSSDPYWRRSVRVSMGTVFKLPIVRSRDLKADARALRGRWGVELVATVTDRDAEPPPPEGEPRAKRVAIVVGPEDQGLDEQWKRLCDRRVTVPMAHGVDSLNISVATAVVLYHYTQRCRA